MKTVLKPEDFVHLHNHTEYSVLDGLTKITPLIELVSSAGMKAIAITDHGTMSGAIEFYKTAKKNNINPLIGMETYVATRKHTEKDPDKDKNRFHLILIAMNNTGYKNLMQLSTIANLEGFYYYPRVDHELIEKFNEGLICLSGCMSGELATALKNDQYKQALDIAKYYKSVFGDRYYLEIQDHGHPKNPMYNKEQEAINAQVIKIGEQLDIKIVVTCDAHYLKHEDQEAHEVLLCVGTASYLNQKDRMSLSDFPLHVTDPNEIISRWANTPGYVLNTKELADRCSVTLEFEKILIPKFVLPEGITEKQFLRDEVYRGLVYRYLDLEVSKNKSIKKEISELPRNVVERCELELGVIDRMGFNGYFLIISDFVNWGKSRGIVFGPGRGSAAGSIVSYALRITEIEPLRYDLLFERFLNPDRISMPDIDIDIQDSRRNEVIQYCVNKYGEDRVANIATFGRMYARNAVRDVSRVLEIPYAEADRLAKMLPLPIQGRHIPLAETIENDSNLKLEYRSNPVSKRVLDLAIKLEGTIRSHGVHAAGIVIAPDKIVKFTPLEMAQKGVVSTQYSLGPIEELGLLKMDLLGLSNLTTIKNTLRIIKRVNKIDLDINKIPLDDKKTFKLLQSGDTVGVFQMESAGMQRYLKELVPTVFEDIVSMNALYRPGPMQWIDDFITRKHDKTKITYIHPKTENALKETYGVIVYQEQVMQISKDLCGFTGGQSDTLRKAISKKKPDELAKMRADFIDGAVKTSGADRSVMERFWEQLEDFASYCFPKSHAVCYALIAYQTAYLKANYSAPFMAALMTSDYDNIDRLAIEIAECQHLGIEVLPPDINESFLEFAIVPETNQVRFGLKAIKNVGSTAVEDILTARESGPFSNMENFLSRINSRVVNKKTLESLIKSGAFDRFGDRNIFLNNLDTIISYSLKLSKQKNTGQTDLFGNLPENDQSSNSKLNLNMSFSPATQQEKLSWERELIGIYLSEHPLSSYKSLLDARTTPLADINLFNNDDSVEIGGLITKIRKISTKNGQEMAFIQIEDLSGQTEIVLFPQIYKKYSDDLKIDHVCLIKGKISNLSKSGDRLSESKVLVSSLKLITYDDANNFKPKKPKLKKVKEDLEKKQSLYIRLTDSNDHDLLHNIKRTIDENIGLTPVVLVLGEGPKKQVIRLPNKINNEENIYSQLSELVGQDNIKLH